MQICYGTAVPHGWHARDRVVARSVVSSKDELGI